MKQQIKQKLTNVFLAIGISAVLLLVPIKVLAIGSDSDAKPGAHAVATAHPLATQVGLDVLQAGGNAFDAAVAISAALAVVEPHGSGLGGGGFWLLHRADGHEVMVDGRERAPLAATRDMYLDDAGVYQSKLSKVGPLAAGIPGTPAALEHLAEKYGTQPLAKLLEPAINLADNGFVISEHLSKRIARRVELMAAFEDTAAIFLLNDEAPAAGHRLVQPELARTLSLMAEQGAANGFYRGDIAARLVTGVQRFGGIWSLEDLRNYRVVERAPIISNFGDAQIVSAAPPSSGGLVIASTLHILEGYRNANLSEADQQHLLIEAWRRAYRDRAEYLGDPDFVAVPMRMLSNPFYAVGLRNSIRLDQATPSATLPGVNPPGNSAGNGGGRDTTHFSVLDSEGNYVAATLSINFSFGSGFVAAGTGVILNNEMDDFAVAPGIANGYGLVGAEANSILAGKRMLSSMSPTFVQSERGVAILGTPGGSRIISMVSQGILSWMQGDNVSEMVAKPRIHHQFLPDIVAHEPSALSDEVRTELQQRGHKLAELKPWGNMQAIFWEPRKDRVSAASDPRGIGSAVVKSVLRK